MPNIIKTHPKKTAILVFVIASFISYKKRRQIFRYTFNQVLCRMNEKMMKQMSEQVSSVDKYNFKLSQLQQCTEEFYCQLSFKDQIISIFGGQKIEELRNLVKSLQKSKTIEYQNKRQDLFEKLNQELQIFGLTVITLSKLLELLIFVSIVLFKRESDNLFQLIDQDTKELEKLFYSIQVDYVQRLYLYYRMKILQTQLPSYSDIMTSQEFIQAFSKITLEGKDKIQVQIDELAEFQKEWKSKSSAQFMRMRESVVNVEERNQHLQAIISAQIKFNEMLDEIWSINEDFNLQSFFYFSQQFQTQKLINRFYLLDQKQQTQEKQVTFRHATNLHRICQEEFLNFNAEQTNEKFYQKKIKQAFNYVNGNIEEMELSQLNFTNLIIQESIQNKTLNLTIRQISRKIFFLGDFEQRDELILQSDPNQPDFTNKLMQLASGIQ